MAPSNKKNAGGDSKLPFISGKNASGTTRSWNSPMTGEPLELVSIPMNIGHRPTSNPTGTYGGVQMKNTREAWSPAKGTEITLPRSINHSPSSAASSPFNYAFPGHKLKATVYESPLKKAFKSPPLPPNREVVSAGPAYSTNLGNVSYREGQASTSSQQQQAPASPPSHTQVMVGSQVTVTPTSSTLSPSIMTSTSQAKAGKGAEGGHLPKVLSNPARTPPPSNAASLIASLVMDAKGIASSRYQQPPSGSKGTFGSPALSKTGNYFSGPGGFKASPSSHASVSLLGSPLWSSNAKQYPSAFTSSPASKPLEKGKSPVLKTLNQGNQQSSPTFGGWGVATSPQGSPHMLRQSQPMFELKPPPPAPSPPTSHSQLSSELNAVVQHVQVEISSHHPGLSPSHPSSSPSQSTPTSGIHLPHTRISLSKQAVSGGPLPSLNPHEVLGSMLPPPTPLHAPPLIIPTFHPPTHTNEAVRQPLNLSMTQRVSTPMQDRRAPSPSPASAAAANSLRLSMSGAGTSLEKQLAGASAWPLPEVDPLRDHPEEGGAESHVEEEDSLTPRLPANLIFEEEKVLGTSPDEETAGGAAEEAEENKDEPDERDEEMEDVEEEGPPDEDNGFNEAMREGKDEEEKEEEDPMAIDEAPAALPEVEVQEQELVDPSQPLPVPVTDDPVSAPEDKEEEPAPTAAPLDEPQVEEEAAAQVMEQSHSPLAQDQHVADPEPLVVTEEPTAPTSESSPMDHDGPDESNVEPTPKEQEEEEEVPEEEQAVVTDPGESNAEGDEGLLQVMEDHMDIGEMSGFEASSLHEGEAAVLSISVEGISSVPPSAKATVPDKPDGRQEEETAAGGEEDVDNAEEEEVEEEDDDLDDSELNDMMVNGVRILGQKYQVECVVGEGAYGMVMRCRKLDDLGIVAIKAFKIEDSDPDAEDVKRTARREVSILRKLQHKHVVGLVDEFYVHDKLFIVMEFVPCNLLELLEAQPGGMDREAIRLIMFQLCTVMQFIHEKGVCYRDIKPENLLVDDVGCLKLCDFGFARFLPSSKEEHLTDYVATRWYRAPELLLGPPFYDDDDQLVQYRYEAPIDMWAIGCLMGELMDGDPLFPGDSDLDQLYRIQSIMGPMLPSHEELFSRHPDNAGIVFNFKDPMTLATRYEGKMDSLELDFMAGLLCMDPDKRLTGAQCLQHPYLASLRALSKEEEAGVTDLLAKMRIEARSRRQSGADDLDEEGGDDMEEDDEGEEGEGEENNLE